MIPCGHERFTLRAAAFGCACVYNRDDLCVTKMKSAALILKRKIKSESECFFKKRMPHHHTNRILQDDLHKELDELDTSGHSDVLLSGLHAENPVSPPPPRGKSPDTRQKVPWVDPPSARALQSVSGDVHANRAW